MSATTSFAIFSRQLTSDLHSLSSESKRRNSEIRHASEKSLDILKTVHSFEDLLRHPDFVVPFILSCSSRNPKFTTISIQCLQKLSATKCIPQGRLDQVLNSLIESTHLAVEIQLKVLQIVPIFFKTYQEFVTGNLCAKLLLCCSNLLQLPNKTPMVVGSASATLQQLINDIFDRVNREDESVEGEFSVLISNSSSIKVSPYRYDANRVFADLCSLADSPNDQTFLLNITTIPEDYGLEILESVLTNHQPLFERQPDLQFLLRTKAVPLLLRPISSSRTFAIVVRSSRCIKLLIRPGFLNILELELEVILSLLTHSLSRESNSPVWKKILALEIFQEVSKDIKLLRGIFHSYDSLKDRKHILVTLLDVLLENLNEPEYQGFLNEFKILAKGDTPIISHEGSSAKIQFIDLLDKSNAPLVDQTYIIYLVLNISNSISDGLGSETLSLSQEDDNEAETKDMIEMFEKMFYGLFQIHKKFLYASTLDTSSFHSLVRAFQKLTHASGILMLQDKLNECLELFSVAIINNIEFDTEEFDKRREEYESNNTSTNVLNAISETLIGSSNTQQQGTVEQYPLHPRTFNLRNVNLFRALISLSISLGATLNTENWRYILVTWQWTSYYIYGPSNDFMENFYNRQIPAAPPLSKSDTATVETSINRFLESTVAYPSSSFNVLLKSLIAQSYKTVCLTNETNVKSPGFHPLGDDGEIQNCIYNRSFFITQLGEITKHNYLRFINENKGKENWKIITNYLIEQIARRDLPSTELRMYAVRIFNEIIKKIATEASDIQANNERKFEIIEDQLLRALMKLIDVVMSLGISRENVYSGVINTESDILFQALRTLKDLLDNFGDYLKHSWNIVFKIINSPFEIIGKGYEIKKSDEVDEDGLAEIVTQKHKDMIQMSFEVFKLISDDFLQTLPLDIIKNVIDTLLNFVTQDRDLNISFSSISQFWLVGDYLRTCTSKETQEDVKLVAEFNSKIKDGKLVETIISKKSHPYEVYNGLWLYLLKKLMECTEDKRLEVKNGAIQTFFRIVDSHAASFPSWDLICLEAIKPLLTARVTNDEPPEISEFLNITLQGLVQLYPAHLSNFSNVQESSDEWSLLFDYINMLTQLSSFDIIFSVFTNFKTLLVTFETFEELPSGILTSCYELWSGYNVVYTNLSKSPSYKKTNSDCLEEFINCYPPLYRLLRKKNLISTEQIEKSLSIFNSAVRYPLLPEFSSDKSRPSSLQAAVYNSLQVYEPNQTPDVELLLLTQMSNIVILPFDTRERIQKKLAHKLPSASKSSIPTFEAISYKVCENLYERILKIEQFEQSYLEPKPLLKILRNLFEPIEVKSLIDFSAEKSLPLWVLSSKCAYEISQRILFLLGKHSDSLVSSISKEFKEEFFEVFVKIAIAPLKRFDLNTDAATEGNDIQEYTAFRDLLLQYLDLSCLEESAIYPFISALWSSSFFYEVDEIEDAIITKSGTLSEVAKQLAYFDFDSILGSTQESPVLTKYKTTSTCLQDLINFTKYSGSGWSKLRKLCVPFLVTRIAFVLRRYISDESLMNRGPISKVRKMELVKVLDGLLDVLNCLTSNGNKEVSNNEILEILQLVYPLLLKTIPVSHKVDGLQTIVQELSLKFNRFVL